MLRHFVCTLLTAFAFSTSTLYSSNNEGAESSRYVPCTLEVNYTSEKVSITNKQQTFYLPKIELKRIETAWANHNPTNINIELKHDDIQTLKNEIGEISVLSEKLGVNNLNPKYLPLYREAVNWLGTRYKWAGNSKKGVDCSGFTNIILKEVYNLQVDRSSRIIARNIGEELDVELLQPGDLVFFATRGRKNINHVGIYLGERRFIHASIKKGVIVSSLDEQYYSRTFRKAGSL